MQRVCQPDAIADAELPWVPLWHTRALLAFLLAVPVAAIAVTPSAASTLLPSRLVTLYAPLLLLNVGLALYVSRFGLGRSRLPALLGSDWLVADRLFGDVSSAALLGVALLAAETMLGAWAGLPESTAAWALVAQTTAERAVWLVVASAVGISEELVYRGYLQRQLTALSSYPSAGVLGQALLFGIAHGEQGAAAVLRFAAYGFGFGLVARFRRSLLPCMLCHVAVDVYAGLAG